MTELDNTGTPITAADALRRAKVEELQRKRAASTGAQGRSPAPVADGPVPIGRATGRKGVATGSKIAAAGFGMATMLGLVGAMGFAQNNSGSTGTPQVIPPAQVVVVIHPATTVATAGGVPGATAAATPAVVAAAPNQPIVLNAQPVVRQAPASQAPVAKTSGSH
jgi:hypothetical protein